MALNLFHQTLQNQAINIAEENAEFEWFNGQSAAERNPSSTLQQWNHWPAWGQPLFTSLSTLFAKWE